MVKLVRSKARQLNRREKSENDKRILSCKGELEYTSTKQLSETKLQLIQYFVTILSLQSQKQFGVLDRKQIHSSSNLGLL